MFGNIDKVLGFGKKEVQPSKAETLKQLKDLNGEEAIALGQFLDKMIVLKQGMMVDRTVADSALQAEIYRTTIDALASQGHDVTEEDLDAFFELAEAETEEGDEDLKMAA